MCPVWRGTTPQTTKGANTITTSYKGTTHIESPIYIFPLLQRKINVVPHPLHNPQQFLQQQQQQRSYAEVVNNNARPKDERTSIFKTFLEEFRGLVSQLIQQNGMILNMLTALVNKYR